MVLKRNLVDVLLILFFLGSIIGGVLVMWVFFVVGGLLLRLWYEVVFVRGMWSFVSVYLFGLCVMWYSCIFGVKLCEWMERIFGWGIWIWIKNGGIRNCCVVNYIIFYWKFLIRGFFWEWIEWWNLRRLWCGLMISIWYWYGIDDVCVWGGGLEIELEFFEVS